VQVELMPEALKKFHENSGSLEKWGFQKRSETFRQDQETFPHQKKREKRRTEKNRKEKQRIY
jgi:hypothetical protein